ncbi:GtrA family protein [Pantoea sp. LMR881]|uniref:GtrA family protein n=1 Tax=Pantoea sp. LMR881 TaxID=3014336 RepID=UPI0022AEB82A|nr:GtrA family protein [Pantoea sp. LMR881]MCZ4060766.1 GtrA family protein [Pantoea sp. LMR881]
MIKLFARYASIGVLNTLIHWAVFAAIYACGFKQSLSNFAAFCIAVTFSFFANAKWTFNSEATTARYILYIIFMGAMATSIGWLADHMHINPLITLVIFSAISLVCGFIYSKFFVFRESK